MTIPVKSGHNDTLNKKLRRHAPWLAVAVSILCALGWLRWQLYRSAEDFKSSFLQQNLSELAAGDTMALSRKLQALESTLGAVCIFGQRANHVFFKEGRGRCATGLLQQQVSISLPENADIAVAVTFPLAQDLAGSALLLILGQIALLAMLSNSTRLTAQAEMSVVLEKERAESAVHRAIAATTQMLAHDVRKPFSILRMGLGMLSSAKDPASVKKVLSRLVPEIDKAVSSVDGLIADVMEIGSSSTQLIQEPASPESLIEATLGEVFGIYPKAEISVSYDLRHAHMVMVHVQKASRVFSNIVGNAVQAMGQRGEIWFRTRERDGLIEFCIGNAGSVIPEESIPKLFDAFFTSGKKGGTGLGLAIAQKVVTAHGGRIWCESAKTLEHPKGNVEFYFTLPASETKNLRPVTQLPQNSNEITQLLLAMADGSTDVGSVDKGELSLEADLITASLTLGRPLKVLVVDDEAVYRSALASYLGRTPEVAQAVTVVQAQNGGNGMLAAGVEAFDLIITDVDMGPDSLDGFELVRAMRAEGVQSLVCVHSNRIVGADHKTAMQAGADAFMPKPVARAQLLRLLLQSAEAALTSGPGTRAEPVRQGAVAVCAKCPEVLIVDDNVFILEAWEDALRDDATVHSVTSLEGLRERLHADPGLVARLMLAVTDLHLDGSAGDGLDVGRLLKSYRPGLRVLLSSDGLTAVADLLGAVDLTIGKDPVPLATLNSL